MFLRITDCVEDEKKWDTNNGNCTLQYKHWFTYKIVRKCPLCRKASRCTRSHFTGGALSPRRHLEDAPCHRSHSSQCESRRSPRTGLRSLKSPCTGRRLRTRRSVCWEFPIEPTLAAKLSRLQWSFQPFLKKKVQQSFTFNTACYQCWII